MESSRWMKSSFSFANSNCLEVRWVKASYSSGNGGNCVEVAPGEGDAFLVRDSKLGAGSPVLEFTAGEWDAFIRGVKDGEFDPASRAGGRPYDRVA